MGAPKGNQNARKGKDWEQTLRRALHNYETDDVPRGEALQRIARECIKQALAGDPIARGEIANRLDGKPTEHVVGEFTHHVEAELSDAELADIAAGRSAGASEAAQGSQEPSAVH